MLIVIEGTDCSGKETQAGMLAEYLKKNGEKVVRIEQPQYDSPTGKFIDDWLHGKWSASGEHPNVNEYAFQMFHIANRLETLPDIVWQQGDEAIIIADRYNTSTRAYGSIAGIPEDLLYRLLKRFPKTDLEILIDIPVEESFRRKPAGRDAYESERPCLEKIRGKYHEIFDASGPHFVKVDGMGTPEEVHERIIHAVEEHLNPPGMLQELF